MTELVGPDGQPLRRQKEITRRRQVSRMKKETSEGDILFQLVVDIPKNISEPDYIRYMVEYFGIGLEVFRGKL